MTTETIDWIACAGADRSGAGPAGAGVIGGVLTAQSRRDRYGLSAASHAAQARTHAVAMASSTANGSGITTCA